MSNIDYHKKQIGLLLDELYALTGRKYKVEEIGYNKIKLIDEHSSFSNYIVANTWKEIRYIIDEIVSMMKLSNQWTRGEIKE